MEQYLQTMAQLLAEAAEETTEVAKRLLGMMDADKTYKTVISTSVADHEVETEFDGGTGDEEAGNGVEAGAAEVAQAAEAAEAAEVKVAFEAGCVLEDDSEESTDVEGEAGEVLSAEERLRKCQLELIQAHQDKRKALALVVQLVGRKKLLRHLVRLYDLRLIPSLPALSPSLVNTSLAHSLP